MFNPRLIALSVSKPMPADELNDVLCLEEHFQLSTEVWAEYVSQCKKGATLAQGAAGDESLLSWWDSYAAAAGCDDAAKNLARQNLAQVAIDVLCMLPTVTTCDSVASIAKHTLGERRGKLSQNRASQLIQGRANGDVWGVFNNFPQLFKNCWGGEEKTQEKEVIEL